MTPHRTEVTNGTTPDRFFLGGPTNDTVPDRVLRPGSVFFLITKNLFLHRTEWWSGVGGGEEFRLQSQEGQDFSTSVPSRQLILMMRSEEQTVDHTKILGIDHDTILP